MTVTLSTAEPSSAPATTSRRRADIQGMRALAVDIDLAAIGQNGCTQRQRHGTVAAGGIEHGAGEADHDQLAGQLAQILLALLALLAGALDCRWG